MESICILTGAGISAESGIQTFRDGDGLWEGYDVTEVATPEAFRRDPELVHEFYNMRRRAVLAARPNAAHMALARLEREYRGRVTVITQNIDDLHERGGSQCVIHMHGEVLKARCTACGQTPEWTADLVKSAPCPACKSIGVLRPHIVWFGEVPLFMDEIKDLIASAALFVSIGTSGNVYPAAGFAALARSAGAHTIEVNPNSTPVSLIFHEHIRGAAGSCVPELVGRLLV